MTSSINNIYKNYDGFGLKQLIHQTSNRFKSHIDGTFALITNTKFNKRPLISEEELNAIFEETSNLSEFNQYIKKEVNLPD